MITYSNQGPWVVGRTSGSIRLDDSGDLSGVVRTNLGFVEVWSSTIAGGISCCSVISEGLEYRRTERGRARTRVGLARMAGELAREVEENCGWGCS